MMGISWVLVVVQLLFVILPVIAFTVIGIYALILAIKALKIYIRKNS